MSRRSTTRVEIDTELLQELREEVPGKSDRELVEDLIVRYLGLVTVRRVQQRSNLSEEEAMEVAVRAVREVRRERRESDRPTHD